MIYRNPGPVTNTGPGALVGGVIAALVVLLVITIVPIIIIWRFVGCTHILTSYISVDKYWDASLWFIVQCA